MKETTDTAIKTEGVEALKKRSFGFIFVKFRNNLLFGLLLAVFIALVLMIFLCPQCMENLDYAIRHMVISSMYGVGMYLALSYLNSHLNQRMPWIKRPWIAFITVFTLNTLVVVSVVAVVNIIWRAIFLGQGPIEALYSLNPMEYLIPIIIGLLITSVFIGASFLNTWKASLLETEQFKQAQLSAKYEALNSQVNPHFLFNSLNVLSILVKKDPDKAEDFIQQLASVYRNVLEFRKEELISLKNEMKTLEAYYFLVQTRFGDRIKLINQLAPSENQFIVPLSLQMLLENAVKHNAATTKLPLQIEIYIADGYIWMKNNRQVLNEKVEGKKVGLENIAERYRLAVKKEIIIEASEQFFKVGLPLIQD